ncbi:unnamed protein product [Cyprideis torosa]|uniref:Uncharacterized protein n=1 Tax=Cyprideis torosa TaxID=163714 RepID=A0A7R8WEP7_9CRUS|nr:unnamed protein product [Cyprideis torosa]CAG0893146.1 unnamed protein product [Cyprideis torosa]
MPRRQGDPQSGICDTYGTKLKEKGYGKAYHLLGRFLILRKDKDMFADWLKEEIGINSRSPNVCANCLHDWM